MLQPSRSYGEVDVSVTAAGEGRYHQQLAETIVGDLRARFPDRSVAIIDFPPAGTPPPEGSLLVTIGGEGCERGIALGGEYRQLCLVVTRNTWQQLSGGQIPPGRAAIFIDQPVSRYLFLARELVPDAKRYATLLGPVSSEVVPQLSATAAKLGVTLNYETISLASNPLRVLSPLFRESQVFVAIPDQARFNRAIAQWALYLGFRSKVPLIGFSRSYTDAGAVASLYTSPADISTQAMEWFEAYFAGNGASGSDENLWQSFPSRYFTIAINPSVVRSLRLQVGDETDIHRRVAERIREEAGE